MPSPALLDQLQITEQDLEQLWTDINRHLATAAPMSRRQGITLPPVDQLIAQAGIKLGPAPREHRGLFSRRRKTAPTATVAEHLAAVADLIDRYGWAQRALQSGQTMCILGAQMTLVRLGHSSADTANRAAEFLDRAVGGGQRYWQWNDSRWRTREQVLDRIRWAAMQARTDGA